MSELDLTLVERLLEMPQARDTASLAIVRRSETRVLKAVADTLRDLAGDILQGDDGGTGYDSASAELALALEARRTDGLLLTAIDLGVPRTYAEEEALILRCLHVGAARGLSVLLGSRPTEDPVQVVQIDSWDPRFRLCIPPETLGLDPWIAACRAVGWTVEVDGRVVMFRQHEPARESLLIDPMEHALGLFGRLTGRAPPPPPAGTHTSIRASPDGLGIEITHDDRSEYRLSLRADEVRGLAARPFGFGQLDERTHLWILTERELEWCPLTRDMSSKLRETPSVVALKFAIASAMLA